jgi:protein SCO1/2
MAAHYALRHPYNRERMTRALAVLGAFCFLLACGEEGKEKPLSEPGERLYTLRGKILARDAGDNTLTVDHEVIPGFMEAMTMDYSVRGAAVAALPADGSRIEARLHVTDRGYWLTDIKRIP